MRRPILGFTTATGLGLLYAASFAPLAHWWLGLLAVAGLIALIDSAQARGSRPIALGGLAAAFGLAAYGAGLSWLYFSLHDIGGLPAPLAIAALAAFVAYLALYPTLAVLAWQRWIHTAAPVPRTLGLATVWSVAEIARGTVFTGFPWLALGYGQIDGPLAVLAPLIGVQGVGWVGAWMAALMAEMYRPGRPRVHAGLILLVLGAGVTLAPRPAWVTPSGPPLTVRLIQGNVPQDLKFRPDRSLAAVQAYSESFLGSKAALTVLPETAWTQPWESTPPEWADRIAAHAAQGHALALGLPIVHPPSAQSPAGGYSNSVLLIRGDRPIEPAAADQRYDKHHLVPFGEFVPWGFRWFVDLMQIPLGDFLRGARRQAALEVGGQRIAFNICYEDLFGEEIRRALPGEDGATVLVNVSNLGWFGNSHALPQHLAIARMRSLETGRPMLRATNTGVTAAIDAQGRVLARLPTFVAGSLDVTVQGMQGLTPYGRWGDAPLWGVLAATLLYTARGRQRERVYRSR